MCCISSCWIVMRLMRHLKMHFSPLLCNNGVLVCVCVLFLQNHHVKKKNPWWWFWKNPRFSSKCSMNSICSSAMDDEVRTGSYWAGESFTATFDGSIDSNCCFFLTSYIFSPTALFITSHEVFSHRHKLCTLILTNTLPSVLHLNFFASPLTVTDAVAILICRA